MTYNSIRPVSSQKREIWTDSQTHTRKNAMGRCKNQGGTPTSLGKQKVAGNKQKPGEEHGTDFFLKP